MLPLRVTAEPDGKAGAMRNHAGLRPQLAVKVMTLVQ